MMGAPSLGSSGGKGGAGGIWEAQWARVLSAHAWATTVCCLGYIWISHLKNSNWSKLPICLAACSSLSPEHHVTPQHTPVLTHCALYEQVPPTGKVPTPCRLYPDIDARKRIMVHGCYLGTSAAGDIPP